MQLLARIVKVNDQIALKSNAVFASMAFFWGALVFSLIPLKFPSLMPFVQYASSGVLQLVALPLLGVGTILAARASDRQSKEQHDAVMESHEDIRQLLCILRDVAIENLKIIHNEDDIIARLEEIKVSLRVQG